MKITQKRIRDHINFYTQEHECVATLFDNQNHIIFDELAYGSALLDDNISGDYVKSQFTKMGLDVYTARYIDACPSLFYPNN